LSHHQRSLIPSLNPTTPLSQSTNWSRMLMSAWSLITKPFTIFASEPLSSPPQPTVILITWSLLPCQESPAVFVSQVNLTLILENSLLTWSHSPVSTSSWLVSLPLLLVDPNNTELLPSLNSPNKCSMLRTWCAPPTPDTEDILLPLLSSEDVCQPKKSMNKCLTFRTRTLHISLNGSPITLNHPFVIFPPRD
jgi:hypothetical protein